MARARRRTSPAVVRNVHHRFDAPTVAAIVLLVLALVLLTVSLTLPWWASFANGAMTSWYPGSSCTAGSCTGYGGSASLASTFGLTGGFVLWAIVATVAAIALFAGSLVWPRLGIDAVALGVVGTILTLVAPIYFYFALPGALTSYGFPVPVAGIFGSGSAGGTSYSWTAAAGWYLAWLIVPILLAGTFAAVASARRHVAEEKAFEELTALEAHAETEMEATLQAVEVTEGEPQRFCPLCGGRYPVTEEFCSKDSAPLKDVVP